MHPRSKTWHGLDMIISRRKHLNNVRITGAYHSADGDTDSSLICTKIQMRPKKFFRIKQPAKLQINTAATVFPENVSLFSDILSSKFGNCQELDTEDHWSHIRDTTHAAALKDFGKKEPKSQDWLNANIMTFQPLIEAKRNALQNYQRNPSSSSLEALREARRRAKEKCNNCVNNYWITDSVLRSSQLLTMEIRGACSRASRRQLDLHHQSLHH